VAFKGVIQLTADGNGGFQGGSFGAIDAASDVCSYSLTAANSSYSMASDGIGRATLHFTSVAPHNCAITDLELDWALVTFRGLPNSVTQFNYATTNPPNNTLGGTCSQQ
jgi:hypothetical protein